MNCLKYFQGTSKTPALLVNHFPFIKVKLSSEDKQALFEQALFKLAKSCKDKEGRTVLEAMARDYKLNHFFS